MAPAQGGAMLSLLLVIACAPNAVVQLSPEAWRQKLTSARPGEHDTWLERLKLKPVTGPSWDTPTLERVDVLPARLSGAKKPEQLVVAIFHARFREERELLSNDVRLYRVQVLQAQGSSWCALSDVLSEDVVAEQTNAGPCDGMKDAWLPQTFSLVHFSHAGQQTIELHKPFDRSSRTTSSGENVEWWDLVSGQLVQRLATSSYKTDCPPCSDDPLSRFSRSWFELRGFPPVDVVRFTVSCDDSSEKACGPIGEEVFSPIWAQVKPG